MAKMISSLFLLFKLLNKNKNILPTQAEGLGKRRWCTSLFTAFEDLRQMPIEPMMSFDRRGSSIYDRPARARCGLFRSVEGGVHMVVQWQKTEVRVPFAPAG